MKNHMAEAFMKLFHKYKSNQPKLFKKGEMTIRECAKEFVYGLEIITIYFLHSEKLTF